MRCSWRSRSPASRNMAASDTTISPDAAVEWEECFYGLLRQGKTVFKAFDLAKSQTGAPMRHIRHRDVVFGAVQRAA